MTQILISWVYVLIALGIAVLGNYIGATWAAKESWLTWWLLPLLVVSPLVFVTFGLVTSRFGVAIGSGTLDSLLTVSTIVMGLIVFHEWDKLTTGQYVALALVVGGIILLHFAAAPES